MQRFNPKAHIDSETIENIENIPYGVRQRWGAKELWSPFLGDYSEKTVVRSGDDALDAFEKYTAYFEYVLDTWEPTSDSLVLLPCGSSKPIGASTIHQKKLQAIRMSAVSDADIVVVSEPCTIVPPRYRMSLPAVNYDFPPQYTEQYSYPEVFEIFTDRLAEWLEEMQYTEIFPYLISGHQKKFDAAIEKMNYTPAIYEIPSASYNPETDSYSGDRFKTQEAVTEKVKAVCAIKADRDCSIGSDYEGFYQNRWGDGS